MRSAAIWLSIALHLGLFLLWTSYEGFVFEKPNDKNPDIIEVQLEEPIAKTNKDLNANQNSDKQPASLAAPSAPTAEEWAFASKYTLKNSKGYRHSFGQQVRSMMGTAVEGPDQGQVRFRIEIAPSGSVTKVETLWKTSDKAEQLARKAITFMPACHPRQLVSHLFLRERSHLRPMPPTTCQSTEMTANPMRPHLIIPLPGTANHRKRSNRINPVKNSVPRN